MSSGERHVINKQHSNASSGYDSFDHVPIGYTPPVMPNSIRSQQHPLVQTETETGPRRVSIPGGPDSIPNERQHYSQPVPPNKSQTTPPNYTTPVHPPHRVVDQTLGPKFSIGPSEEQHRERSASPQLQHATLPGLGHVLIYPLEVGPYFYGGGPGGNPPQLKDDYWQTNAQSNNISRPPLTNAQTGGMPQLGGVASQSSPILVIKTDHSGNQTKTGRSNSQPASNLQWHRRSHPSSHQDSTDGRGHFDKSYSEDSGRDTRRYSAPLQEPLEEEGTPVITGGYDLPFLSSREELQRYTCPICKLIYREPHLTDCCGACFCHSCIRRSLNSNSCCPICQKTNYHVFIDRNTERNVNQLKVRCPHEDDGCTWNGLLVHLSLHTDLQKGDCEYINVSCSYCGREVNLNKLENHKIDCPRRPFSCKFCNYKGIYEDMPLVHWPSCDGYPTTCPNKCGRMDMPRRDLTRHLREECTSRPTECDFKFAGCNLSFPRSESIKHQTDSAHHHLVLLGRLVQSLMIKQEAPPTSHALGDLQALLAEKDKETMELKRQIELRDETILELQKSVSSLREDYEDMKTDLSRLRSNILTPPYSFVVTRFSELRATGRQWFSRPFYTHPQGYRMCISMDCNGSDEGSGTHVSVYANLMKGEFDDDLNWPFCGVVVIQLLNQFGDKGHIVHEVPFSRDVPPEIGGRVQDSDLAESGLGVPQFIAHGRLALDRYTNVGFIKSDSLHFCVLRVKLG